MTDAEIIQDALEWAAENGEYSVATKCAAALAALERIKAEVENLRLTREAWANEGAKLAASLRAIMMESGEPVSAEKAERALREFEGPEGGSLLDGE